MSKRTDNLYKPCPKCEQPLHVCAKACKHCGHKQARKGKPGPRAKPDAVQNGHRFVVAVASDGCLFTMREESGEYEFFSVAETAQIRKALGV